VTVDVEIKIDYDTEEPHTFLAENIGLQEAETWMTILELQ
jgi:hypothetical protein